MRNARNELTKIILSIRHGWGDVMYKPGAVVGHEIVGRVTRVGSLVKGFALGQRVGFGAQAGSCLSCSYCKAGWENMCDKEIPTYQGEWEDGSVSQGGYADYVCTPNMSYYPTG
jgi:alcohol dehydrogenase (NADP+)